MKSKIKRASILALIIYIMTNSFVWGLMKVYINSHNSASEEKLVMAEISDNPNGREVKILGQSFIIFPEISDNNISKALKSFTPFKIKAVSKIIKLIEQEISS